MIPALNVLHSVGCKGLNARCCEYAADVVAFAEDECVLKSISCVDDISELQVLATDDHTKFSAIALSDDGSTILAGDFDGCLSLIKISEPKTYLTITLPINDDRDAKQPIECIVNDGHDRFAVAVGRHIYIISYNGDVRTTLGPLPTPVLDLKWHHHPTSRQDQKISSTDAPPLCLIAVTSSECYIYPIKYDSTGTKITAVEPIVLPCSQKEQQESTPLSPDQEKSTSSCTSCLAVSPKSQYLALNCGKNKCEINCWDLDNLLSAPTSSTTTSSNGAACREETAETVPDTTAQAPPPCLTLPLYDNPVNCITWDTSGRYLATSDGPDCTIWDMSRTSEVQAVHNADSIMCCGHDPSTRITCLAFQPDDGSLLATVSNTGKLALFDSRRFRCGGVCGPYATACYDFTSSIHRSKNSNSSGSGVGEEEEGEEVRQRAEVDSRGDTTGEKEDNLDVGEVKLLWISKNRLLLAIPQRELIFYSVHSPSAAGGGSSGLVSDTASEQTKHLEVSISPGGVNSGDESEVKHQSERMQLHRLAIDNLNMNTPVEQACVEYTSSPLTPHRDSGDLDSVESSGGGEEGEESQEIERKEEKVGGIQLDIIEELDDEEESQPREEEPENQVEVEIPLPAPIRTRQKPKETQSASSNTEKPPPPPSLPTPPSNYNSGPPRPSSAAPVTPARPTVPNSITSPRRAINTNHNPNYGMHYLPKSPGGSMHLEQRIQQLRDAPPMDRGDHRHPELTGWGLGVSGGGGGPGMSWVMTPGGGLSPMPAPGVAIPMPMAVPGGGGGGGVMANVGGGVQFQQQHLQHHMQQQHMQHSVMMYPTSGMPAMHAVPAGVMGSSPPMMQYQYAYPQYYPSHSHMVQAGQHQQQSPPFQQQMIMMVHVPAPSAGPGATATAGAAVPGGMPAPHVQMMTPLPPQHHPQHHGYHQQGQLTHQPPPPTAPYPGSPLTSSRAGMYSTSSSQNISSPRSPAGSTHQQQHQRHQMQSQQWAGIAPGYMSYQHGAVPYDGGTGGTSSTGTSGGRVPGGVSPPITPGSYANQPHGSHGFGQAVPVVQLRPQQHQQMPQSPPPPASRSPQAGGGNGTGAMKEKSTVEKQGDQVNSSADVASPTQRSLQKRGSKGGSSGSSTSKTAAAAAAVAAAAEAPATATAGPELPPRVSLDSTLSSRQYSDETANSVDTHDHNNKNGAAAAATPLSERRESGDASISPPSSLTPSPRQSNHNPKQRVSNNSRGVTPPVSPLATHQQSHPPSSTSSGAGLPSSSSSPQEPSSIIYLGNLPQSIDDQTLYWTCAHFGPVVHVQIIRDKKSNTSRGYGFVTFAHPVYANVAMQNMDGQMMYGPYGGQKIRAAPTYKKCVESVAGA